jgi:ribosomal protein L16/L10AE
MKSFSGKKLIKKTTNLKAKHLFSNLSLLADESGKITNFQAESFRKSLRRFLKKKAQIFFRPFFHIPVTKKSKNVRLGRGKANACY